MDRIEFIHRVKRGEDVITLLNEHAEQCEAPEPEDAVQDALMNHLEQNHDWTNIVTDAERLYELVHATINDQVAQQEEDERLHQEVINDFIVMEDNLHAGKPWM